jgi:hypothetical protein
MTYFSKNWSTAMSSADGSTASGTTFAQGYGVESSKLEATVAGISDGSVAEAVIAMEGTLELLDAPGNVIEAVNTLEACDSFLEPAEV